jgi:ketosteroid isomerase-like protein
MPHTMSAGRALEDYFDAWLRHDVNLVQRTFAEDATYEIRPRNRVLSGRQAIGDYWRRNAGRQSRLTLQWTTLDSRPDYARARFSARFHDLETNSPVAVAGEMQIWVRGGRIERLSEDYSICPPGKAER